MLITTPPAPFHAPRRVSLMQGVSVTTLLVAGALAPLATPARAAGLSLNQALALSHSAASTNAAANVASGSVNAARQAALGAANIAAGAARFYSLNQALIAASNVAAQASVADGLAAGGLQTADGASNPATGLWVGAGLPTQTTADGRANVVVKQSKALATLTWKTFNVGAKTSLTFDQSAGGTAASSWVAINTVQDPTANMAQILGSISAPGKVYIVDTNGIAFGNTAKINVGGLVATTGVIAQSQYSRDVSGAITGFNLYGGQSGSGFVPSFTGATGAIDVAAGATISTPTPTGTQSGGAVLLLGKTVSNAGAIATPKGQTILAAGDDFVLRAGYSPNANTTATTLGSEIATTGSGTASNAGVISAQQGDITMAAQTISETGDLLSSTTVNARGSVHLLTSTTDTAASITIGSKALIEIVPQEVDDPTAGTSAAQTTGLTAQESKRTTDITNSAIYNAARLAQATAQNPQLNNANTLADLAGSSRIEISTGGNVDFQAGALAIATGGQIAVGAGSRVLVEKNATLDVSGSSTAILQAGVDAAKVSVSNQLFVNIQPYQLRDSAGNRVGPLKSTDVYINTADLVEITSGAYAGNIYTKGGLLEVGGYLGQVDHQISEWTAAGGTVTLQASRTDTVNGTLATIGGEVITQAGSTINMTGGVVNYAAGMVHQTYVQSIDGRIFTVNDAPGNLIYKGIYNGVSETQSRWGVSDTFVNPGLAPSQTYQAAYTIGRDAGKLVVNAATAVLNGDMPAGVTIGQNQAGARPASVADPYVLAQTVAPQGGALAIGNYIGGALAGAYNSRVVVTNTTLDASGISIGSTLPDGYANTVVVSADALHADDFANLSIITAGNLAVQTSLSVADGGSITLDGGTITADSSITARGGSIGLSNIATVNGALTQLAADGSITVDNGAVLDTRGVWVNLQRDPNDVVGISHINGGSVSLLATGGITLDKTSAIDVSSGGALRANGSLTLATGGSVSISADIVPLDVTSQRTDTVTLDGAVRGYGSKGGGTYSLTAPSIVIGAPATAAGQVALDTARFDLGFGKYVLNGTTGLTIADGAVLAPVMPIYELSNGAGISTGGNPADAFSVVLPTLYAQVKNTSAVVQRGGASVALQSAVNAAVPNGGGGAVTIGHAARVSVDPGQAIALAGYGQINVFGSLTAHGGTVSVANTRYEQIFSDTSVQQPLNYQAGQSVWLGANSVVDVSGDSIVLTDALNRRYGTVHSGGSIVLGGLSNATDAQVIVRPGAVLNADGTSAVFDVVAGVTGSGPISVVSGGGSISARSYNGIAFDGDLHARAGGATASGGALSLRIDPLNLDAYKNTPFALYNSRSIIISDKTVAVQDNPNLQPGDVAADASFGIGRVSQAQIDAGGFNQLTLTAQDSILFDGNVSLHTGRSITLSAGLIGETPQLAGATPAAYAVSIAAPYVKLNGYNGDVGAAPSGSASLGLSTLSINANLIDAANAIYFGGVRHIGAPATDSSGNTITGTATASADGFGQINLTSTGDIRLLGGTGNYNYIDSRGNFTITAAQLYPVTGASAVIRAGDNQFAASLANQYYNGTITVNGTGHVPSQPYSVGGTLGLVAEKIYQNGVVRAPEGSLRLGVQPSDVSSPRDGYSQKISFGVGSVTSVSLAGITVPYGGTVDGVNYTYNGTSVGVFAPSIELDAQVVYAPQGATIDISGGGTLSGAGFIAGRGGSADVLKTPLLNNAGNTVAAVSGDQVYAIVPGYTSAYAPVAPDDQNYTATSIGEQITIGGTIPGLPAGTYTLLPAYYALLPGAYRVELTSSAITTGTAYDAGNYAMLAPVHRGIGNTAISASLPTAALITSGTNVRNLSQYGEETYSAYEIASSKSAGAPRPFLPQDAKVLSLVYPNRQTNDTPLTLDASVLVDAPQTNAGTIGGYGATLEISGATAFTIVGAGDTAATNSVSIDAATIDALSISRLVLGGILQPSNGSPSVIDLYATASSVTVAPHATLRAGDIMIGVSYGFGGSGASGGQIDIQGDTTTGATLTTIGTNLQPLASAFDVNDGYYFSTNFVSNAFAVLDVSSGRNVFIPTNLSAKSSGITIADNAALYAAGSLDVVAPVTTSVSIGRASLGAKYVNFSASSINIGSAENLAALTAQLPSGIELTQDTLSALLHGNAAVGTPAAQQLILTATQAVNLVGAVAINTGSTDLVLNTPAIYGYGASTDSDSISAANFNWSGLPSAQINSSGTTLTVSALPGGQIAGSAGHVVKDLSINAATITLGYGAFAQANNQVTLDRLLAGFGQVSLNAATAITANAKSSLSAYATIPTYGEAGLGGTLVLASPLLTTQSGAVLGLTAGGDVRQTGAPSSTASATTLGGEIDIRATNIDIASAIALPAGKLTLTAQDAITVDATASIDLAGRTKFLVDQTQTSRGGTLNVESTAGNIVLAAGSQIDVSAPGSNAGAIALSALAGSVDVAGTLRGSAGASHTAGSFSVIAGTMVSAFDALNTMLDSGGFTGARAFEIAIGDIVVDQKITARSVNIAADHGAITVLGTIDAHGTTPGSITLSGGAGVTLAAASVLDAHETVQAVDSSGTPIDAENRAHVTLSTVGTGTIVLNPGATINVSSAGSTALGQIVLNAPRVGADAVAVSAPGSLNLLGAASIDLYAFKSYMVGDASGSFGQNQATGAKLTLAYVNQDAQNFMAALGQNAALPAQIAGLTVKGASFHLAPGIEIDSSAVSGGNITVLGDLDLSTLRYSDIGYGLQVTRDAKGNIIAGSGEAGSIVFRAANNLIINGSISDGFATPLDAKVANYVTADRGWKIISSTFGPTADPLNADIVLPTGIFATGKGGVSITDLVLAGIDGSGAPNNVGTTYDTTRAISLNYDITIATARINPNTRVRFAANLGAALTIPQGGWIATAAIINAAGVVLFAPGQLIPGGTSIPAGSTLGAGTVMPVAIQVADGTALPAGTLLSTFTDTSLTLWLDVKIVANALLPSNTAPVFATSAGKLVSTVYLRPNQTDSAGNVWQGRLYPLAQMLPAGSQSFDLKFIAGANTSAADSAAVLPKSVIDGGALAATANTINQQAGSIILDDQHYVSLAAFSATLAYSVIRTGTGDLTLVAGGGIDQSSLYGIYTAGTQTSTGNAATDASFDLARYAQGKKNALITGDAALAALVSKSYAAWYPDHGGDVAIAAQGNVTGDIFAGNGNSGLPSDAVGNWLWRQGSSELGINTAWWINFGTFVNPYQASGSDAGATPQMVGFQGIGALGGGNVRVNIGGDAGQISNREGANNSGEFRGEGLIIAVGGTGRAVNGSTTLTGGGRIDLTIGGTLNPLDENALGLTAKDYAGTNGALVDLRGAVNVDAGAIGRVDLAYVSGSSNLNDPRVADPFNANNGAGAGGIIVVPGDATVDIYSNRDLVLGGAGDPGRLPTQVRTKVAQSVLNAYPTQPTTGHYNNKGIYTGFSLWTDATSISLTSSGGNVTPTTQPEQTVGIAVGSLITNNMATDYRFIYPTTLLVAAESGDIIYGAQGTNNNKTSLETAPSANGQVSFVASGSIFANDYSIDISGADPALTPSIARPAFSSAANAGTALTNVLPYGGQDQVTNVLGLFSFEADTPTTNLHANDSVPARFYAASGDIVNFTSGETFNFSSIDNEPVSTWYVAAKPVWIVAGRDIVSSGTRPSVYPSSDAIFGSQPNQASSPFTTAPSVTTSGNLFMNGGDTSLSLVQAGRDILSSYFYVGGGGLLEVAAGRNINQGSETLAGQQSLFFGAIKSLGSLISGSKVSLTGGADIAVLAGLGSGVNDQGFGTAYLDPNPYQKIGITDVYDPSKPITDAANLGKVQANYGIAFQISYVDSNGVTQTAYTSTLFTQAVLSGYNPAANGYAATTKTVTTTTGGTAVIAVVDTSAASHPDARDVVQGTDWYSASASHTPDPTKDSVYAYLQSLPAINQQVLYRAIFFDETKASGRQYSDATNKFYHSYVRGRQAIDTLFLPLDELTVWLSANHGYTGASNGAQAAFGALASTDQQPFLDLIYREDTAGAKLLLDQTGAYTRAAGVPDGYVGAITMYSGTILNGQSAIATPAGAPVVYDSGIATLFGGNIQVLNPGGQMELGIPGGPAPGASSGIITYGSGDISVFTKDSVVLGKSRVFTTDGGNIAIWSAQGDINAGIGAKTTVVYNPPLISYDALGDLTLIPTVPTNGAGIATLAPLASVVPGDVDLVAPLGTIDAGEAGIRVSGNLVLAAATISNATNISVGGKSSGAPTVTTPSLGSVQAASASAGASTAAGQSSANGRDDKKHQASIVEVEVISIGGSFDEDERKKKKRGV